VWEQGRGFALLTALLDFVPGLAEELDVGANLVVSGAAGCSSNDEAARIALATRIVIFYDLVGLGLGGGFSVLLVSSLTFFVALLFSSSERYHRIRAVWTIRTLA